MKVFLHTRGPKQYPWQNDLRDFARIPAVGEYLALDKTSDWYRVILVVHTAFRSDCVAEVYAEKVDPNEVKKQALG